MLPSNDHLLVDGNTPSAGYDHIRSILHTEAVSKSIQNQSTKRILNRNSQLVAAQEGTPRATEPPCPNSVPGRVKPWMGADLFGSHAFRRPLLHLTSLLLSPLPSPEPTCGNGAPCSAVHLKKWSRRRKTLSSRRFSSINWLEENERVPAKLLPKVLQS